MKGWAEFKAHHNTKCLVEQWLFLEILIHCKSIERINLSNSNLRFRYSWMGVSSSCSSHCLYIVCWEVRISGKIVSSARLKCTLLCTICVLYSSVVSVLLIPAKCNKISLCIEDERDLRVDCLIKPEPSKSNTFQFSWSSGSKESIITTNDSRLPPDTDFKTTVKELKPHGYRMTLTNFTEKLPRNSSLLCKLSGKTASVVVVNGEWMSASVVWRCEHDDVWLGEKCEILLTVVGISPLFPCR